MCNIQQGAILEFWSSANSNSGITCEVVNDRQVEYQDKIWSLSSLARMLSKSEWPVAGPRFFKYNGEWLNDIRKQMEDS